MRSNVAIVPTCWFVAAFVAVASGAFARVPFTSSASSASRSSDEFHWGLQIA